MSRTTKSERTRVAILEAARSVFAKLGYEGASMRVIASALEMREASLYYHFANKSELYAAVITEAIGEFESAFFALTASGEDAQGYLTVLAQLYLDSLDRFRDVSVLLAAESRRDPIDRVITEDGFAEVLQRRRQHLSRQLNIAAPALYSENERMLIATHFLNNLFGAWAVETAFGSRSWAAPDRFRYVQRLTSQLLG